MNNQSSWWQQEMSDLLSDPQRVQQYEKRMGKKPSGEYDDSSFEGLARCIFDHAILRGYSAARIGYDKIVVSQNDNVCIVHLCTQDARHFAVKSMDEYIHEMGSPTVSDGPGPLFG